MNMADLTRFWGKTRSAQQAIVFGDTRRVGPRWTRSPTRWRAGWRYAVCVKAIASRDDAEPA